MQKAMENTLASYVDALRPIIYINHFDFAVVDKVIQNIAQGTNILEFNNALGLVNFQNKSPMMEEWDLITFLKRTREDGFERNTFLVLKDVHDSLREPRVIALLKRIAEDNLTRENYYVTVFIVSSELVIPAELENYITVVDVPLPDLKEISEIIYDFVREMDIQVDPDTIDEIALSFKGMNEFQIRQILNLAYQDGGSIDERDKKLILKEKEQFIKKAGILELVNFSETVDDIGGLENLKSWLKRKAVIFNNLDQAIKFGVDVPKGIMLVGMPGCGKSLTAKVTASMFSVPLVRLDVGRLLGKYVGESEDNMRKALRLAEATSPCVLWIDEIEKAFSGVSSGNGNEVTTRLFGQFLTWMQEKDNTVFIVATANDITKIPAEFLRKGRFDEMFSVDLPNDEERKKIFEIHLRKRHKWNRSIDILALINETKEYSGADIEAVVKETVEYAFVTGKSEITTEMLIQTIKQTKSTRVMLADKMAEMKAKMDKMSFKSASLKDGETLPTQEFTPYQTKQSPKVNSNRTKQTAEVSKMSSLSESDRIRQDFYQSVYDLTKGRYNYVLGSLKEERK